MSKSIRSTSSCAAMHARREGGMPARPASQAGFTLIELMITVAIIGILAAVALPSYQSYIRRGQLQEAFANLSDYRIKMEQYYQDNKGYGSTACASDGTGSLPGTPTPGHPNWSTFAPADAKYFTYGCSVPPAAQTYTVTATGTLGATGYSYTIDQTGAKRTTFYKGAASTATCWLSNSASC